MTEVPKVLVSSSVVYPYCDHRDQPTLLASPCGDQGSTAATGMLAADDAGVLNRASSNLEITCLLPESMELW